MRLRGSSWPLPIFFSSKKNLLSKLNCVRFLCLFSVWLAFCCLQIRMLCCLVCCCLLHYHEWLMGSVYLGCALLTFSLLHSRLHYFNFLFHPVKVKVAQSCPTLCDPIDYTVHGILQARILEWAAVPFSRETSQPRDRTQVSCLVGRFFTGEPQRKPLWKDFIHWKDRN